jgi:PAS domain S-box-containing protein
VTDASSRWEEFTGQPLDEALGNGWISRLHPDDVAPTQDAIQRCLAAGEPIDIHYRVRKANGEWLSMRSRGSPRFGPAGNIIGVYGVVEEVIAITPRKDWKQPLATN